MAPHEKTLSFYEALFEKYREKLHEATYSSYHAVITKNHEYLRILDHFNTKVSRIIKYPNILLYIKRKLASEISHLEQLCDQVESIFE